ncbi:hypothetical protein ACMHYB_41365 [Sorangium sp. So ce1128]
MATFAFLRIAIEAEKHVALGIVQPHAGPDVSALQASEVGAHHDEHFVDGARFARYGRAHHEADESPRDDQRGQRRRERVNPFWLVTPGEELRS